MFKIILERILDSSLRRGHFYEVRIDRGADYDLYGHVEAPRPRK